MKTALDFLALAYKDLVEKMKNVMMKLKVLKKLMK